MSSKFSTIFRLPPDALVVLSTDFLVLLAPICLFSESTQILNTFFHSETVENLEGTDESVIYDGSIQTIEERIQNFNQRGSNWRFQRVLSLDVHFTDFQPSSIGNGGFSAVLKKLRLNRTIPLYYFPSNGFHVVVQSRAGSGSRHGVTSEALLGTTVGRKLCFRRAPVVHWGFIWFHFMVSMLWCKAEQAREVVTE